MECIKDFCSTMPAWLLALGVVLIGWLTAAILRSVATKTLALLPLQHFFDRTGVSTFLRKGEVQHTPAQLFGRAIFWVVLISAFLCAAMILDVVVLEQLRQRLTANLPAILAAGFVLVVGLLIVKFAAGFVRTVVRNEGSPYADLWARITKWAGTILVLAVAFEQSEIRGSFLATTLQVIIAAVAFGTALAFGLGCKDIARTAMEKFLRYLRERHTDRSKPDLEG